MGGPGGRGPGAEEPLLSAYPHFNYGSRPRRDSTAAIAYLLLFTACLLFPVGQLVLRPGILQTLSPSYLDDPANCPLQLDVLVDLRAAPPRSSGRVLLGRLRDSAIRAVAAARHALAPAPVSLPYSSPDDDAAAAAGGAGPGGGGAPAADVLRELLAYNAALLLLSFVAALVLAAGFMVVVRYSAWSLVLLSCAMQVGAPLAASALAMAAGNSSLALALLLSAAVVAVCLYASRDSLRLVARLLGVAAVALRDNPAILGLVACLKLALAGATLLLLAAAAVVAAAGDVVPNPLRAGSPKCAAPGGDAVQCCAWAPSPALPVYLPLISCVVAWTLLLLFELKVYVISGVVAQWYFPQPGRWGLGSLSDSGPGGEGHSSGRALAASVGHALGPSFGSLCAGSAVLGATSGLRAAATSVIRMQHHSSAAPSPPSCCCCCCYACKYLVAGMFHCCCSCLVELITQLSKFATAYCAISGMSFWQSSREVVALLSRNLVDAYGVWWYVPVVLHSGAIACAGAWGYACYLLGIYASSFTQAPSLSAPAALALAVAAAATAELVLAFICSTLGNIVDVLYLLFCLDREAATATWAELHIVLVRLPCCAEATHGHSDPHGYGTAAAAPPPYYYLPPQDHYPVPDPYAPPQLGYPLNYARPTYASAPSTSGFWGLGWLRSPSGAAAGTPAPARDRPQHPPPAVLSPPYSDRFPIRPPGVS